jgi:hypothetical protein
MGPTTKQVFFGVGALLSFISYPDSLIIPPKNCMISFARTSGKFASMTDIDRILDMLKVCATMAEKDDRLSLVQYLIGLAMAEAAYQRTLRREPAARQNPLCP